jgi:hypothetical protein
MKFYFSFTFDSASLIKSVCSVIISTNSIVESCPSQIDGQKQITPDWESFFSTLIVWAFCDLIREIGMIYFDGDLGDNLTFGIYDFETSGLITTDIFLRSLDNRFRLLC